MLLPSAGLLFGPVGRRRVRRQGRRRLAPSPDPVLKLAVAPRQSLALPIATQQSYVGIYQGKNADIREIVLNDGRLFYGESGQEKEALITLNSTTFTLTSNSDFKLLINHSDNKVSGITRQFIDGFSIPMSKLD